MAEYLVWCSSRSILIGARTSTEKLIEDELPMTRLKRGAALDLPARSITRLVCKRL